MSRSKPHLELGGQDADRLDLLHQQRLPVADRFGLVEAVAVGEQLTRPSRGDDTSVDFALHTCQLPRWFELFGLARQAHQLPAVDGCGVGQTHVVGLDLSHANPVVECRLHAVSYLLDLSAVGTLSVLLLERVRAKQLQDRAECQRAISLIAGLGASAEPGP